MSWLSNTTDTNLIKSTYLKGFVDISGGDVILRNGNVYVSGNATITGNTYVNTNLGIGTIPTQPLDVSGNVNFRNNLYISGDISLNTRLFVGGDASLNGRLYVANGVTSTAVNNFSDYRIKDNIQPIITTQYTVDALRPVFYDNQLTKKQEFGLIAHEVQEIFPFAVNGEKDGLEYQTVNYIELISLLVNEVQQMKQLAKELMPLAEKTREQQLTIADLQAQIDLLKNSL